MKLTRRQKIIDWAYDEHNLLNPISNTVIIVTAIWWAMEDIARIQKGINKGEIVVEK